MEVASRQSYLYQNALQMSRHSYIFSIFSWNMNVRLIWPVIFSVQCYSRLHHTTKAAPTLTLKYFQQKQGCKTDWTVYRRDRAERWWPLILWTLQQLSPAQTKHSTGHLLQKIFILTVQVTFWIHIISVFIQHVTSRIRFQVTIMEVKTVSAQFYCGVQQYQVTRH